MRVNERLANKPLAARLVTRLTSLKWDTLLSISYVQILAVQPLSDLPTVFSSAVVSVQTRQPLMKVILRRVSPALIQQRDVVLALVTREDDGAIGGDHALGGERVDAAWRVAGASGAAEEG